ncbi:MAG: hypothetical protein ACRDJN_13825, partial [Chloroflexota bacterium]
MTDQQLAAPVAGALLHRIVRFGRALRAAGIGANPGRLADFTASLPLIDLRRRDDFYYAARTTLLSRPDQREDFDAIFARFWPPGRAPLTGPPDGSSSAPGAQQDAEAGEDGAAEGTAAEAQRLVPTTAASPGDASDEPPSDARGPTSAIMSYSQEEVLREKNFGDYTEDELARARRLLERMRWQAARRLTRRSVAARRGESLDLRRT